MALWPELNGDQAKLYAEPINWWVENLIIQQGIFILCSYVD